MIVSYAMEAQNYRRLGRCTAAWSRTVVEEYNIFGIMATIVCRGICMRALCSHSVPQTGIVKHIVVIPTELLPSTFHLRNTLNILKGVGRGPFNSLLWIGFSNFDRNNFFANNMPECLHQGVSPCTVPVFRGINLTLESREHILARKGHLQSCGIEPHSKVLCTTKAAECECHLLD